MQVPLALCITQGAEGIKWRIGRAVLAVRKGLVCIYSLEGYLRIPTSLFLQLLYFQLRNYFQVPLRYDSRQIKLLTMSKTCQLEAGGYKVHICGRGGRIIVKTPAQVNTTSAAAGFYMKITLHPTPPRLPRNTILLQSWGD